MPERLSTFRVDASEVMGEDAYVVIKPITQGKALDNKRSIQSVQRQLEKAQSADSPDLALLDELEARQVALGNQLFVDHIIGWNWVDDAGEPLPLPSDDIAVMDALYSHEIEWLGEAIGGTTSRKKSSSK